MSLRFIDCTVWRRVIIKLFYKVINLNVIESNRCCNDFITKGFVFKLHFEYKKGF